MGAGMIMAAGQVSPAQAPQPAHHWAIVVHGGAGVIERSKMSATKEASYRAGLAAALDAGFGVLERGGSSLDAVTAAVRSGSSW